jgi:hypothetical protein
MNKASWSQVHYTLNAGYDTSGIENYAGETQLAEALNAAAPKSIEPVLTDR